MDYRKSKRSMNNGNCVEVASGVMVRDTTDREGVVLNFPAKAWSSFVYSIKVVPE